VHSKYEQQRAGTCVARACLTRRQGSEQECEAADRRWHLNEILCVAACIRTVAVGQPSVSQAAVSDVGALPIVLLT
jgi:hypothetical protein